MTSAQERPGPADDDLDEQFASIVRGWDLPATQSGSQHLAHLDPAPSTGDPDAVDEPDTPPSRPPSLSRLDLPDLEAGLLEGWRGYSPPEVEEHFEPPEPDLPPAHDATYWLSVVGIVAGPLVVVWAVFLSGNPDPGWWVLIGALATVVGFGLLLARGSGERDPDDDGAVV